jgi:hypothetical protein
MFTTNLIRRLLLAQLDLTQDHRGVIDSLPIPVVQFHLVPGSSGERAAYGANFGCIESKKETIFGYKLHLLITLGGLILDFELAPANASDGEVGFELLAEHTDLTVIGDKAYLSAKKAAELWQTNRIRLQTLPKRNQKQQLTAAAKRLINSVRQLIETVRSTANSPSSSTSKPIMPTLFGACVPACMPSSLLIPCVFTSIVSWASPTSCRSRPWLSQTSISP